MGRSAIVVGGGIGGLSAARALVRTGWDVNVYEQAPEIRPVGAGVGIGPNAVRAMDWLGLGDQLRARGVWQDGMRIRLQSGRQVVGLPGAAIRRRYGEPFVALHRAELHDILLSSLDPAILHTGHSAVRVHTDDDAASVTFDTAQGPHTATADLVVAADGVRSRLRASLFPAYPGPSYAGYTVWRGIVATTDASALHIPPVLSETWGQAARFGIAVIDGGRVYWFACESMPEHDTPEHSLSALADRFRRWHDPIPGLLAATADHTLLRHDVYYLRHPLRRFIQGRVVLLGDAAHAVTPDIGQGACLAVEDAVVLADALSRRSIAEALTAYDTLRRARTQPMVKSSGRLAHVLQLADPIAVGLRDGLASLIPASAFLRFAGAAFAWTPPQPAD